MGESSLLELYKYILEVAKFLIVTYQLVGLKPALSKKKYLAIPCMILLGLIIVVNVKYAVLADALIYVCLMLFLFQEKLRLMLSCAVLEVLGIWFIDLLMWLICVGATPLGTGYPDNEIIVEIVSNSLGLAPLIIIALVFRRKKISVRKSLNNIQVAKYLIVVLIMLSMIFITACLQGVFIGDTDFDMGVKRLVLIASVLLAVFTVVLCALYIYVMDAKTKLSEINSLNEECIEYQKSYYQSVMKKDDELRAFKHDVKSHYAALNALFVEKKYDEMGEYLAELSQHVEAEQVYNTGKIVADYIINGKIKEIREQTDVEIKVVGKFPRKEILDNTEICIILANILDNAKEAILECEGEKKLEIEIRNYKRNRYITIRNSSPKRTYERGKSTKKNKNDHGFGMRNVERIVDKYNGTLNTRWEKGLFITEIEIQEA